MNRMCGFSIFPFLLLILLSCDDFEAKVSEQKKTDIPATVSTIPEKTETISALDSYFHKLHDQGVFNGNVLVAVSDNIIFNASYGYTDWNRRISLTKETPFQLASVSKQFTAVSILILKERGRLNLDDAIEKFYPDFPYRGITLRMLLLHRSGLPNYIYFCDNYLKQSVVPVSNQFVIRLMTLVKPEAYYPPDLKYDYSNTGYMILAAIVEKVAHKPFAEFLRQEIFQPLGMKHSYVPNYQSDTSSRFALGYRSGWRQVQKTYLDGVVGDKGIYASCHDLFLWNKALYSGKIIRKSTLMEAFTPHVKQPGKNRNYGYGWRIEYLEDSTKVMFHSGWWEGFQALLVSVPRDSCTIVVLKNMKAGNIDRKEILRMLYSESITAGEAQKINPEDTMDDGRDNN